MERPASLLLYNPYHAALENIRRWESPMRDIFRRFAWTGAFIALFLALRWQGGAGFWEGLLIRPGAWISDLLVTYWPNMHYIKVWFQATGHLPQWRTLIFSGAPLVGDPRGGLAYPPNLLHLLIPETAAFHLLLWGHLTLGATGMSLLAREKGLSPFAQSLATLAFGLSPRFYGHWGLGHVNLVYAMGYIPWVWMGYRRLSRAPSWTWVGLTGWSLGWQAALHPQIALYTVLTGLVFLVPGLRARSIGPTMRQTGASLLLAFGVGAGVFSPLLHHRSWLWRRGALSAAQMGVFALQPADVLGLVLPHYGGYADTLLYLGFPLLLLGLVANLRHPLRLLGFGLLLLYGWMGSTPTGAHILTRLPGLNGLRAAGRIWTVGYPLWVLTAAQGLDLWRRCRLDCRTRWRRYGLLLPFTLGMAVLSYHVLYGPPPLPWFVAALLSLATWWVLGWTLNERTWRQHLPLLVLLAVDLGVMDASLVEVRPLESFFRHPALVAFLKEQQDRAGPLRVYSPTYSLPRHEAARAGLETADGIDALFSATYDRFMEAATGVRRLRYSVTVPYFHDPGPGPVLQANRHARPQPCLLGLLNVRYVLTPYPLAASAFTWVGVRDGVRIYENPCWLPRAFLVGRTVPQETPEAALRWIQRHDVARYAAVEQGLFLESGDVRGQIDWESYTPDLWRLRVTTDRKAFLVLSLSWHPDWRAWVDGRPAPLYRTNGTLTGLYVPAGTHQIELRFHARAYTLGMVVSLLSHVLVGILVFVPGRSHPTG